MDEPRDDALRGAGLLLLAVAVIQTLVIFAMLILLQWVRDEQLAESIGGTALILACSVAVFGLGGLALILGNRRRR